MPIPSKPGLKFKVALKVFEENKGSNFCQKKINCLLKLTNKMLPISRNEWDEIAIQQNSFFQNTTRMVIC